MNTESQNKEDPDYCKARLIELGKNDVALLQSFFSKIYIHSFPQENERDSFEELYNALERSLNGQDERIFHVILAVDKATNILGGIIYSFFPTSSCGFIEYVATSSEHRSNGIGAILVEACHSSLLRDASQHNTSLFGIWGEIKRPGLSEADSFDCNDIKRLRFWDKHRALRVLFPYTQPSLGPGKNPVDGIDLFFIGEKNSDPQPMTTTKLGQIITDYARLAMRIEEPTKDETVAKMLRALGNMCTIPTEPLLTGYAQKDQTSAHRIAT